jgi:hypothetical protein
MPEELEDLVRIVEVEPIKEGVIIIEDIKKKYLGKWKIE